jgi:phage repressor protein C with HTH and peptisase S24 domain
MKSKKLLTGINHIKTLLTTFIKEPLFLVEVEGESAWPELIPGKIYFASKLKRPKVGNFIVFSSPRNKSEIFVKKIKQIRDNFYVVSGNVPWASSSKDFGEIHSELVLGAIINKP